LIAPTSLIILTYNCLRYTQACLLSISQHSPDCEVIVVDNASSDGTPAYLAEQAGLKLILNPENKGYAAGNNQGLAVSQGQFLLLLNNDVIVTPRWLEHMHAHFEKHPRLGILGPRTNCISGAQQLDLNYDPWDIASINAVAEQRARHFSGQLSKTQRVAGFAMLLRREVYQAIGGLDEQFGTGNFEDDDYCQRALQAGYEIGIAEDAFIHHFGSVSFLENGIDYKAQMETNRRLFFSKWGTNTPSAYLPSWPEVQRLLPRGFTEVLDLGCKSGKFGAALKQRDPHFQLTGIESNPLLAAEARPIYDQFLECPLESDWSLADQRFDAVVFNGSLEICRQPGDLLKKVQSYLKSDGIIIVNVANACYWPLLKKWLGGKWDYREGALPEKGQLRFYTSQDLVIMFESCGLMVERWYATPGYSPTDGLTLEKAEKMLQELGINNRLSDEAGVARWIGIGGPKKTQAPRQKRYGIQQPVVYWENPSSDQPALLNPDIPSTTTLLPESNITIHCGRPEQIHLNSGTFVHLARLSGNPTLSLEGLERLKAMDHIWVDSEDLQKTLLERGFSPEQTSFLPLIGPEWSKEQTAELRHQLWHLCEKLKLLRS
jgi:GT2 family glycosyltransferase